MVQRGVDTAAELSDVLAQKLSSAADRRPRPLRKRKWALRLALFFTLSCGFWVAVTAVLAVVEHAGVGPVHPGADSGRCGLPGDAVVPALSLAPQRTASPTAVAGHPAATTVRIGGPATDGRAGRIRTPGCSR